MPLPPATRFVLVRCADCPWAEAADGATGANRLLKGRARRHATREGHTVTHTLTITTEIPPGRRPRQRYRGRDRA